MVLSRVGIPLSCLKKRRSPGADPTADKSWIRTTRWQQRNHSGLPQVLHCTVCCELVAGNLCSTLHHFCGAGLLWRRSCWQNEPAMANLNFVSWQRKLSNCQVPDFYFIWKSKTTRKLYEAVGHPASSAGHARRRRVLLLRAQFNPIGRSLLKKDFYRREGKGRHFCFGDKDDIKKRINCTRMLWRKGWIHPILHIVLVLNS